MHPTITLIFELYSEHGLPHMALSMPNRFQALVASLVRAVIPEAPITWDKVAITLLVSLLPLLLFVIKNWTETLLVILAALCTYSILKSGITWRSLIPDSATGLIIVALVAPFLANLVAILMRGDLRYEMLHDDLDCLNGPSRLLLGAVIFLWLRYLKAQPMIVLSVVFPLVALITLPFAHYEAVPGRFSTRLIGFTDFGEQICLIGAFIFLTLLLLPPRSKALLSLLVVSLIASCFIAFRTQTRGGWIAIPVVLFFLPFVYRGPKIRIIVAFLATVLAIAVVSVSSPALRSRIESVYSEPKAAFNGTEQGTSTGTRLTMLIISWELIKQRPIWGWGPNSAYREAVYALDPKIYHMPPEGYVNREDPRQTLVEICAHNQYFMDWLRGGILSIISMILLLAIPLVIFSRNLRGATGMPYLAACMGINMAACFAVFSLTEGPFGLKVFWSFYGFMIAVLASQALSDQDTKNPLKQPEPSQA
jgi:O-antigen ligase